MKNRRVIFGVVAVLAVGGVLYAIGFGRTNVGGRGGSAGPASSTAMKTDPWLTAVTELVRQPDAVTARRVLAQLNSDLDTNNQPLPMITPEAVAKLGPLFNPSPDELRDWQSKTFTPMDGNYLGEALFFRAVARSLDVDGLPDDQKAMAAFAWISRQMYPRPWLMPGPMVMPPIPPQDALRRGYGTGLEREAAFLALGRQLGLDVLLVGPAGAETKSRYDKQPPNPTERGRFWAVGVRTGDDVTLFDPWFGEVMPAKLKAARNTPSVVVNWVDAKKSNFPIPANDVTGASLYLVASPAALTPRMKLLESQLAGQTGVKLFVDADETAARCANLPGGPAKWHSPPLNVDPFAPSHLLGFFTPQLEGGYDQRPANQGQLAALAREFEPRQTRSFTPTTELTMPMAREEFARRAAEVHKQMIFDSGIREKIHRGQFNDAIGQLVELDRNLTTLRQALRHNPELVKQLSMLYGEANKAYEALRLAHLAENADKRPAAEQAVATLWSLKPMTLAVQGAAAETAAFEVAYLLALAKHEQAERSQVRHRKAGQKDGPTAAKAAEDWAAAAARWADALRDAEAHDADHPGRRAHARKLADRAAALAANPDAAP